MAKKQDTLAQLVSQYSELKDMALDPEIDAEVLAGSLEAIEGEIEVKFNGYGYVVNSLKMEQAAQKARISYLKDVIKGMDEHLKALANKQKKLEDAMLLGMITTGLADDGIKTEMFDIQVQNVGGVQELWTDIDHIPNEFMKTEIVVKPDNDKIREFIKTNKVEWARLLPRKKKVVIK